MKTIFTTLFAMVISFAVLFTSQQTAAADAGKYVQSLGDRAISTISKEGITQEDIQKEFYTILDRYFDTAAIGRFVMGRHWRDASEQQRTEFLRLFKNMIVRMYSTRFTDYSDEKFRVDPQVVKTNRDHIVRSEIIFAGNRPPVKLEWRVRPNKDGAYKVIDLMIEGVSMSITQRSEFDAIIRRNGIDGLLETMRKNYQ